MTADASVGWEQLASEKEGAAVIAGLLSLEPDREYARSELAAAADIPLKTLYLVDTVDQLEAVGMLDRLAVDEESETKFVLNSDSDLYQVAVEFGELFAERSSTEQ